jgi:hypothetical protein
VSMALAPPERARLAKILGLLGSDYDGERASAGAMAWAFLRERGLTWFDLFSPSPEKSGRESVKYRRGFRGAEYRRGFRDGMEAARQEAAKSARQEAADPPEYCDARDWPVICTKCLSSRYHWTKWQREFLVSVADSPFLSDKQRAVLERLHRLAFGRPP